MRDLVDEHITALTGDNVSIGDERYWELLRYHGLHRQYTDYLNGAEDPTPNSSTEKVE